jgi:hypothetical protein
MSAPEIGHNKGPELAGDPEDLTILQNKVRREHSETFDRIDYLTQKFAEIPKVIETEDEQGVAQEIFKSMRAIISKAEKERRSAQEPHERRVAVIMATFKKPSDALGGLKDALSLRIDDYLKRKKEKAQIEAERKANEERLEAERKARAAEEAERARIEEQRKAEAAAAAALKARLEKEAEARKAAAMRERARRLEKLAPYLELRAERESRRKKLSAEAAAIAAENARRRADDEARNAATAAAIAKEKAARSRAEENSQLRAAEKATERAEDHAEETEIALRGAVRMEATSRKTEVKSRDITALSQTRGDFGSVGSLSLRWSWRPADENYLAFVDLDILRAFIAPDALEAAITKFVNSGGRKLGGVIIEQTEKGRVK